MKPLARTRVEHATIRRGPGWALLVLALAGCTAVSPPAVPPRLAAELDWARRAPWPALCQVPPRPEAAELASRTQVREAIERARARTAAAAAELRGRYGLTIARAEPRREAPAPQATAVMAPAVVEMGAGRTVRAETATGSLVDLLDWIEEAVRPGGRRRE